MLLGDHLLMFQRIHLEDQVARQVDPEDECTVDHSQLQELQAQFIHSIFCLTTGPKPPPKRFLHIVQSRASSFQMRVSSPVLKVIQ